jgi:hypothetical protein
MYPPGKTNQAQVYGRAIYAINQTFFKEKIDKGKCPGNEGRAGFQA